MKKLKIDIVSDVSCPWCIIGYKGLDKAIKDLADEIETEIEWHPFELNPHMPEEGQEIVEHLTEKYGISIQQSEQNREAIKQRGLDVGYEFGNRGGGRIYNTFDAHRLLDWAKSKDKQTDLKLALFDLYFKQSGNPSNHEDLLEVVKAVDLPVEEAKQILNSDAQAQNVRAQQQHNQQMGITSVPAVIIDRKYLISGGQPADVFKNALQEIAAKQVT